MPGVVVEPQVPNPSARDLLEVADWRRRIAELYADVRRLAALDPEAAWELWRSVREALYREHPQSPVPAAERAGFRGRYYPYDPAYRLTATVEVPDGPAGARSRSDGAAMTLPASSGEPARFHVLATLRIPFPEGEGRLVCFWLSSYAGGLFLPFRDATNGRTTYGAGRYLLDAAKGADLGGDPASGTLVLDFNFAYQPSCAFDPRWSCPLAPPANRLGFEVPVGERIR